MRKLLAILSVSMLSFTAHAVTVSCTASVSGLAFGIYNPLSPAADTSTGSLHVTCTGRGRGSQRVSVGVALSAGLSGTFSPRRMFSGANTLDYNIYWSTAYAQVMGDGTGGSYSGSAGPFTVYGGSSTTASGTMYGRIPALQDVAPGGYADTILVTVTY